MTDKVVIAHVKKWIEQFIIKYEICPFAAVPYFKDKIHFVVSFASSREDQLFDLARLYVLMMSTESALLSNSFIIYPDEKCDFEEFLFMDEMAALLLEEYGYENDLQVVLFHPGFRYDDEDSDDPSNYTNRSPYPMIHVLRKSEVDVVIKSHHDIHSIPVRNQKLLKSMEEVKVNRIRILLNEKEY